MEDLSLHVLDIVENSIAAGARRVEIQIRESRREDLLSIQIVDDGRGMSQETLRRVTDPFFTTRRERRVGLGLSLLEQAARAAGGRLELQSSPGAGTKVAAVFGLTHPDRQPLGDVAQTLLALAVGNPEVEFEYLHESNGWQGSFNTAEIKARLAGRPLSSPEGIAALRKALESIRQGAAYGTSHY